MFTGFVEPAGGLVEVGEEPGHRGWPGPAGDGGGEDAADRLVLGVQAQQRDVGRRAAHGQRRDERDAEPGRDTAELAGPLSLPVATAPADAVLLFDGVFLLRPELINRWDLSIFVSVTFERTLDRARGPRHGTRRTPADPTEIERSWRNRYIPSQQLYFAQARPADHADHADLIVHNDDLQQPAWEVKPHRSAHGT